MKIQVTIFRLKKKYFTELTENLVVEESESLVDVGHHPSVRVDVKAVDHLDMIF